MRGLWAGKRRVAALALMVLVVAGLAQLAGGGYIAAKAWLAQILLLRSWESTLADGRKVRPWPWADTYPVARLRVPALGIDEIVLAGVSGRSLAFGPGHLDGTARPGTAGHAVIAGHRDTHFRFLARLRAGMRLDLQRPDGRWRGFVVTGTEVIDSRRAWLAVPREQASLSLVTCYPLNAVVPGGPLRYVVSAEARRADVSPVGGLTLQAATRRLENREQRPDVARKNAAAAP